MYLLISVIVFVISGVYVWEVRLQACPFVQPGLLTKIDNNNNNNNTLLEYLDLFLTELCYLQIFLQLKLYSHLKFISFIYLFIKALQHKC